MLLVLLLLLLLLKKNTHGGLKKNTHGGLFRLCCAATTLAISNINVAARSYSARLMMQDRLLLLVVALLLLLLLHEVMHTRVRFQGSIKAVPRILQAHSCSVSYCCWSMACSKSTGDHVGTECK